MLAKMEKETIIFQIIGFIFITLMTLYCLIPFLLVISASFSQERDIYEFGYRLIPRRFSLDAYKIIFKAPHSLIRAYSITIFLSTVGASIGLFLISMTAYVLQRRDFKYRNKLAFFFYFTSLFNGGMIPSYLLIVKYLNLKDTILALLLPPLFSAWLILLMRNFMKTIPDSISESAKIDGADDFRIFVRIILPISIPGLATIGLFLSLMYWNDWYHAMLYIESPKLYPLQYFLYNILGRVRFAQNVMSEAALVLPEMPTESLKMAMAVVVTGPVIFLYPLVQKYFVKGLTIGALKG